MVTPCDFVDRLKSQNYIHVLYKQYDVKVLLKRFHLNGHTIGLYPQAHPTKNKILNKQRLQHHGKVLLKRFHLNTPTIRFCPKTQKLGPLFTAHQSNLGVKRFFFLLKSTSYPNGRFSNLLHLLEKVSNSFEVQHLTGKVSNLKAMFQPVINDKFQMVLDICSS